jgi:hypothetical protein
MTPNHFHRVMQTPYFRMENQAPLKCKCLECKIENFFIRFFNKNRTK